MSPWRHFRPGDWLTLLAGLGLTAWLAATTWHAGAPRTLIIRAGGRVFAEAPIDHAQRIAVPGPLGTSIVEIQAGRARVAADPGPRQLCVRQGWLHRAGDTALCLPNQLSIELIGRTQRFDGLNY